jgi:NTE family protein
VGTAWLAGLAAGLRREGVDLGAADLIVGTSAGAIVGAIVAGGGDLDRLATLPPPTDPGGGVRTDPESLAAVFATLGDAETGEAVIWDRHGTASLPEAVAASTAFPGTAPPITIGGRRYIDGALRAGINLDLASDAGVLIVAEPMAQVSGPDGAAAGERVVVRLVPDAGAIEAFGKDITERTRWAPAYQAGVRQAPEAAGRIREYWVDPP